MLLWSGDETQNHRLRRNEKLLLASMQVLGTLVAADAQSIVLAQYDFENPTLASTDTDSSTTASAFQLGPGITTFTTHHVGDTSSVPFATTAATGDTNFTGDSGVFASLKPPIRRRRARWQITTTSSSPSLRIWASPSASTSFSLRSPAAA